MGYKEIDYEYLGQIKEGKLLFTWDRNLYHRGYYYTPKELEGAVAVVIDTLWQQAVRQARGRDFEGLVMGVPVEFSRLALDRLLAAIDLTGRVAKENVYLVSEPTAIALRYIEEGYRGEKYVLVFDYGGGTLDLSLVEYFSAGDAIQFKILNKAGYPFAGRNIDMEFAATIEKDFVPDLRTRLEAHGHKKISSVREIRDLDFWQEVERAKIDLSTKETTHLALPRLGIDVGKIPRSILEKSIRGLLGHIRDKVLETLQGASISEGRVDRVLLAGGSSQIPAVKRLLKKIFGEKVDERYAGPGTSTQGLALALQSWDRFEDVTSHNLYLWDFASNNPKLILPARIPFKEASHDKQMNRGGGLSLSMEEPATKAILLSCEEVDTELMPISFWVIRAPKPFRHLRLVAHWEPNEGSYTIKAYDQETSRPLEVSKLGINDTHENSKDGEDRSEEMPIVEVGNIIRAQQGNAITMGEVLGIRHINSAEERSFAAGDFSRFILTVFDPEKLVTTSLRPSNEQFAVLVPDADRKAVKEQYGVREFYQTARQYKRPFTSSFRYCLDAPAKEVLHKCPA